MPAPRAARRHLIPSAVVSQGRLEINMSRRLLSAREAREKCNAPEAESGFAEGEETSAAAAAAAAEACGSGLPLHVAAAAGEASASSPSLPLSVVSPSDVFTRGSAALLLPPLDDLDEDFLNAFVMPSSLCSPQRTCEVLHKMHVGMEV
jgi:hypothetical protein